MIRDILLHFPFEEYQFQEFHKVDPSLGYSLERDTETVLSPPGGYVGRYTRQPKVHSSFVQNPKVSLVE
jgi:hypothetical protein